MNVSSPSGKHARVLREIFQHPIPHNLEWPDVLSLLQYLGDVRERHDGKYEVQIGTTHEVFARPLHKDIETEELVRLRKFLTQVGVTPEGVQSTSAGAAQQQKPPVVLVIDHQLARFFEPSSDGGHLVEQEHVAPPNPHDFERHLKEEGYEAERVPEASEFYEGVAQRLRAAPGPIVLIGDAHGKSSALTFFTQYLQKKYKDVWDRVVATEHADLSSLTVAQMEQIGRRHTQNANN